MHPIHSRGFTLIELLVVIAIIGILSAVVLASLGAARAKGEDAAIQADLGSIQTEAELFYSSAGANSYGSAQTFGNCTTANTLFSLDPVIVNAVNGIQNNNGKLSCFSTSIAYAISSSVNIANTGSYYFCVDSVGFAGTTSVAVNTTHC